MTSVHAWLMSQVAFDLVIAEAASQHTLGLGGTESGEHWQWQCWHCDAVLDLIQQYLNEHDFLTCIECGSTTVGVRSVERYYSDEKRVGRGYPHLVTSSIEEIVPATAIHIKFNDPAAVIKRAVAFEQMIRNHRLIEKPDLASYYNSCYTCSGCGCEVRRFLDFACPTILLLASLYSDRFGYQERWAPK